MITIVFRMVIKKGKEEEFKNLTKELTKSAYKDSERCVQYMFHQSVDDPKEFILYEKWRDQKALDAHINRLITLLGPREKNSILPAKLNDYFEKTEDLLYKES